MTRYAIVKGLRSELRAYVLQQGPTSTAALQEAAKVAEATIVPSPTVSDEILEAIRRLEMSATAPMFASSLSRSPSPAPGTTRSAPATRRVHFGVNQAYPQTPLQKSHHSPTPYAMPPTKNHLLTTLLAVAAQRRPQFTTSNSNRRVNASIIDTSLLRMALGLNVSLTIVNNFVELKIRRKHPRALLDTAAYCNCLNLSLANRFENKIFCYFT